MRRNGSIVTIICITLSTFIITPGQSRPRPRPRSAPPAPAPATVSTPARRAVTVNLKQGDPVTGNFVRADAETVQVEMASGRLTIKMSDVASLVFAADAPGKTAEEAAKNPAPANPAASPAARKAYTALRKLADAAQLGLPYGQYGNLLIETKAIVSEAMATIPESTLKTYLAQAMDAYTDAGQAWSAMQTKGNLLIATEPAATLMNKYSIRPDVNQLGQADHLRLDTTLSTIWAAAGNHLNNVAALLKQ
jgi:hypothetical protein